MPVMDFDGDDTPAPSPPQRNGMHAPESFETAVPVPVTRPFRQARGLGRTLPDTTDAESGLLGAMFVDPDDVIPRIIEARITPDSFQSPDSAAILRAALDLHHQGHPVDTATVAGELKSIPELAGANIYSLLMGVTDRTATTAQAGYFIGKIREHMTLRAIVLAATRTVEECYGFSGDIDSFAEEAHARMGRVLDTATAATDAEINARAFSMAALVPRPDAIFSIAGIPICTPGNITAVYAPSKAGKTALESAAIAATMTNPTSGHDTLGLTGPNYGKGAVVHFDTEQSKYDWQQKTVLTALRRVSQKDPPPWLMSFHLTGMEARRAREFILRALRLAKKRHGEIHSVFIDGIADLVTSPNNEEESYECVRMLHAAAIEFNTAIICILHLNPTSKDKIDKGRGHLGSQLERKSESNLTLKKDGDVTTLLGDGRQRNGPIPKDKSPSFKWSDEHQMHRSCVAESRPDDSPKGRPKKFEFSQFVTIFPREKEKAMTRNALFNFAKEISSVNETTFRNILNDAVDDGMLARLPVKAGGYSYYVP